MSLRSLKAAARNPGISRSCRLVGRDFDVIEIEGPCTVELVGCRWRSLRAHRARVIATYCEARDVRRNAVLLDKCHDSLIDWLLVQNTSASSASSAVNPSSIEDNVNFFASINCTLSHSFIWSSIPLQSDSGSGIMIDRWSRHCSALRNYIFDTRNTGAGIAGGEHNELRDNTICQSGGGAGGNIGLYVSLDGTYAGDVFQGNTATANYVFWAKYDGKQNRWWSADPEILRALDAGNVPLSVPADPRVALAEWTKLRDRRKGIGSRV